MLHDEDVLRSLVTLIPFVWVGGKFFYYGIKGYYERNDSNDDTKLNF